MESLFNARETAHLADVRDLFRALFTIQAVAIAAVLTLAVVMLVRWPVRALAAAALSGSLLTVGLIGLAGIVALTGFDAAWNQFHFLAFSNDFWAAEPRYRSPDPDVPGVFLAGYHVTHRRGDDSRVPPYRQCCRRVPHR